MGRMTYLELLPQLLLVGLEVCCDQLPKLRAMRDVVIGQMPSIIEQELPELCALETVQRLKQAMTRQQPRLLIQRDRESERNT